MSSETSAPKPLTLSAAEIDQVIILSLMHPYTYKFQEWVDAQFQAAEQDAAVLKLKQEHDNDIDAALWATARNEQQQLAKEEIWIEREFCRHGAYDPGVMSRRRKWNADCALAALVEALPLPLCRDIASLELPALPSDARLDNYWLYRDIEW